MAFHSIRAEIAGFPSRIKAKSRCGAGGGNLGLLRAKRAGVVVKSQMPDWVLSGRAVQCSRWRGTQAVRERSAKPLCVGSIPTRASIFTKQVDIAHCNSEPNHRTTWWEPPHLCGGRSALAFRERVSNLIRRFLCSLVAPARFLRLSLTKAAYSVASSAAYRKSGFSAGNGKAALVPA